MTADLNQLRQSWRSGRINKQQFIEQTHSVHSVLFQYPPLLAESEIQNIELSTEGVVFVSRQGLKFICAPDDFRAAPIEALNFGTYEAEDAALFQSVLRPDQTVIDIGANIGWYALHVAIAFPTSHVVAIEPAPATAEFLRQNIKLNRVANVEVIEAACTNQSGTTQFFVPVQLPTASSTSDILGTGISTSVAGCRLDALVAERRLRPDVIKIDVEGGELEVLRGAERTLREYHPVVFCEMLRKWAARHGYHPNDTVSYMAELGYRCGFAGSNGFTRLESMTDDVEATNFLFFNDDQ